MFSWFRKKKLVDRTPTKVWMDEDRKFAGFIHLVQVHRQTHGVVLAVAQFEAARIRLERALRDAGIDFVPFDKRLMAAIGSRSEKTPVWIVSPERFRTRYPPADFRNQRVRFSMLVIDRHPLAEPEQKILEFAESIPFHVSLTFFCSLDDPLVSSFSREGSLQALMQNLGAEECLEHAMIDSSLRSIQKKIARVIGREKRAESTQEWFRLNLPDGV